MDGAAELMDVSKVENEVHAAQTVIPQSEPQVEMVPRWRVALIIVSSACLSGIAVVIWNRHALARMRQAGKAAATSESMATLSEFV